MMTPRGGIQTEIGAPFNQQIKVDKVYSPQSFNCQGILRRVTSAPSRGFSGMNLQIGVPGATSLGFKAAGSDFSALSLIF
jgi:hypothetical protein